jgi:hypothetical protein
VFLRLRRGEQGHFEIGRGHGKRLSNRGFEDLIRLKDEFDVR